MHMHSPVADIVENMAFVRSSERRQCSVQKVHVDHVVAMRVLRDMQRKSADARRHDLFAERREEASERADFFSEQEERLAVLNECCRALRMDPADPDVREELLRIEAEAREECDGQRNTEEDEAFALFLWHQQQNNADQ